VIKSAKDIGIGVIGVGIMGRGHALYLSEYVKGGKVVAIYDANLETAQKVAKEVFNKECLTTTQIMQVMEIFINEMKKLEFAKFAYKFCSEKDKYFRLNKAFISELRVRELTDYVKSQR